MKMKNMVAYIKRKQFYFALFACCVTLFLIAALVWIRPQEEETDIADLNSDVITAHNSGEELPSDLVDNPTTIDEPEPEVAPTSATPTTINSEEPVDVEEPVGEEGSDDGLVANEEPQTENVIIEIAPVVKPNITFEEDEKMIWPVSGDILMNYSMTPIHFKTLDQYKVNPAVFIAAEVGSEVLVAAEGIVETVVDDPQTGTTVTIYHGNGYKSIYGQLDKELAVKEGDMVKKGQIIGSVETPTKYHVLLDSHVYFKVTINEEAVDPATLIQ